MLNAMMRAAELGDFLRTRRELLDPSAVGIPGGSNRRTPGLRREEVAVLASLNSRSNSVQNTNPSATPGIGTMSHRSHPKFG